MNAFTPLSPGCDQDRISPYTISTISSRQVMRIKKISIIGGTNSKFSKLALYKL